MDSKKINSPANRRGIIPLCMEGKNFFLKVNGRIEKNFCKGH